MTAERIIGFAGDMDHAAATQMARRVAQFVADGPADHFVVDLGAVTFIDSAGLAALLTIRNHAHRNGVGVTLRNPPRQARRAIESAGMRSLFTYEAGPSVVDELDMVLPAEPRAQRLARAAIGERWPAMEEGILDDLLLIVSELVSNAVRHGQPEIQLWIRSKPFAIEVSVLDHGASLPPLSPPEIDFLTSESGRGLALIENLSHAWGITPLDGSAGKSVWATLSTA